MKKAYCRWLSIATQICGSRNLSASFFIPPKRATCHRSRHLDSLIIAYFHCIIARATVEGRRLRCIRLQPRPTGRRMTQRCWRSALQEPAIHAINERYDRFSKCFDRCSWLSHRSNAMRRSRNVTGVATTISHVLLTESFGGNEKIGVTQPSMKMTRYQPS